jgi:hypothetical protein
MKNTPGGIVMKSLPCVLAAVAVALAAGCAVPQASIGTTVAAAAQSSSYYCAKERLAADGGRLECNWQPTADEACKFADTRVLERGSLASDPQPAGRCNTGQWLVKVSVR